MAEDYVNYRFWLDCHKNDDATDDPRQERGMDSEKLVERGNILWNARGRNGFKLIVLYDGGAEDWTALKSWPEDAIDDL